ncbi:hypothetical protein, partial [Bartonella sp. AC67GZZY]
MIKIFRNHVCLCACTTAILSLLQNGREVYAAAEEDGKPYVIKVIPVVSANSSPYLSGNNKHKLPL